MKYPMSHVLRDLRHSAMYFIQVNLWVHLDVGDRSWKLVSCLCAVLVPGSNVKPPLKSCRPMWVEIFQSNLVGEQIPVHRERHFSSACVESEAGRVPDVQAGLVYVSQVSLTHRWLWPQVHFDIHLISNTEKIKRFFSTRRNYAFYK